MEDKNIEKCPVSEEAKQAWLKSAAGKADESRHGKKPPSGKVPAEGGTVYNVYSEPIDPRNQMPTQPSQLPSPGQNTVLPQEREVSQIPKGNTDNETWVYPSPQMFYNALLRKNKADNVEPELVPTVVSLHNAMNEHTWTRILAWEQRYFTTPSCPDPPSLLRFKGRPDTLSPLARYRTSLKQFPIPFDRHDWTVERCGTIRRYILDYYYHEASSEDANPMVVEVRPAVDSVGAAWARLKDALATAGAGGLTRPPVSVGGLEVQSVADVMKVADEEEFEALTGLTKEKVDEAELEIRTKCAGAMKALETLIESQNKVDPSNKDAATDPEAFQVALKHADHAMRLCGGRVVCPDAAAQVDKVLNAAETPNPLEFDAAFNSLDACLKRWSTAAQRVRHAPHAK